MQKDDIVFPFPHAHRRAGDIVEPLCEHRQLVIMRGE